MDLDRNAELKKILDCFSRTEKKVRKIVPKSRCIKSFRSSLKLLMLPYDSLFFRELVDRCFPLNSTDRIEGDTRDSMSYYYCIAGLNKTIL